MLQTIVFLVLNAVLLYVLQAKLTKLNFVVRFLIIGSVLLLSGYAAEKIARLMR